MAAPDNYTYTHSTGTTTISVRGSVLHSIVINATVASIITVYDGTVSGTVIAVFKASVVEGTYLYDVKITSGLLTVVLAGASDITVTTAA